MPTEQRRITAIPDLDALAVLGYDIDEDGPSVCMTGPARRMAQLVQRAGRDLDATLDRAEWNAIADVMNGCADIFDYADSSIPPMTLLVANLTDGDEMNGLGEKWEISVADLIRKLNTLTPVHGEAILCAIRWAWRHVEEWDHAKDEWWKPAFRLNKGEK